MVTAKTGRKRTAKPAAKTPASAQTPAVTARKSRPQPANTYHAIGRRKTAVALVRLNANGPAGFMVNRKTLAEYFPTNTLQGVATAPLRAVNKHEQFGCAVKVYGGGFRSQAEAVRHGLSRCLVKFDATLRPTLKPLGFLTRDPRMKERKKPGLKRARRAPQWSKR